jgi:hypothetical protein
VSEGQKRQAFPQDFFSGAERAPLLGEWKVRFDPRHVGVMDDGRFCELPLALGVLRRHEVTACGMGAHYFPGSRDLEALGDGFSGFAARDGLRHKARKISTPPGSDNRFSVYRRVNPAMI